MKKCLWRKLSKELKIKSKKSNKVRLAIAFWGIGAFKGLNLKYAKSVEIICNLKIGGTKSHELRKLLANNITVYTHDTLHAKMGVIDDLGFLALVIPPKNHWVDK